MTDRVVMMTVGPSALVSPTFSAALRGYTWLAALLTVDAVLTGGDILLRHGVLADTRFSVGVERGYGELFQYVKLAATAGVLAWLAWAWRSWTTLFWAGLFVYLLVDDAFAVHEQMGETMAHVFALPEVGRARPRQVGELIFLGFVGTVAALGIAATLRSASLIVLRLTLTLAAGLELLTVFGVGVDFVHSLLRGHWLAPTAAVVEDGGELVVTSGLLWVVWRMRDPHMGGEPSSRARVLGAPET